MTMPCLIDCDPGVDDALALILAFRALPMNVMAVTGVHGNVPIEAGYRNIRKVLGFIRPEIPPLVAKGADCPLQDKCIHAFHVHGEDGLGGALKETRNLEAYARAFSGSADRLITDMARSSPGELTLIATGPLTDVALAVQNDFDAMTMLKRLVVMGGAVRTGGNVSPHAEFNIFADPLAAQVVFQSGLPITLVPLDATHQAFLSSQIVEERVMPVQNRFSKFLIEASGYEPTTRQFRTGEFFYLHDPLAVAVAAYPDLAKREKLSLTVETQEGDHRACTCECPESPPIDVCTTVDTKRFLDLFLSAFEVS
jgi:purine nucleosidase